MSDSVRPHRQQPTRLLCPWDSPGKNTGVGCHFLLQCVKVKSEREVAQSCLTLSDPMACSLLGSSVHGIFQARVLEWVPLPSPKTQTSYYQTSICCCSVDQPCPTFCNPMNCSTPGFPVHYQLLELAQTHVHRVSDAIQPSYPLLSPSPPAFNLSQHQGFSQ